MPYKLLRFADTPPDRLMDRTLHRRLSDRLRQRLVHALRGEYRSGSAVRDLGCTISELKSHLERLFTPGMAWDNYGHGLGKWGIDHIAPLSSFNLTDRNQLLAVCHYSNLQPMWFEDNMAKGDKVMPRVVVDLSEVCYA